MHARISTEKGAALDTFYVQNSSSGQKETDYDTLASLNDELNALIGHKPAE